MKLTFARTVIRPQSTNPGTTTKRIGVNDQPQQIEAIVREVLRRLRALDDSSDNAADSSADNAAVVREETASSASTLEWDQPLVTWTRLASQLDGYSHVTFPPRIIVSPLVRDELKQRGIRWTVRDTARTENQTKATRHLLVWGQAGSRQRELASLLAKQLNSSTLQVAVALDSGPGSSDDSFASTSLDSLSGKLASLRDESTRAILLSQTPYRCCCDINRHREACAVVVSHAAHVVQMIQEARPNVLVFDLGRQPFSEILHALRIYLRHWPNSAQSRDDSNLSNMPNPSR